MCRCQGKCSKQLSGVFAHVQDKRSPASLCPQDEPVVASPMYRSTPHRGVLVTASAHCRCGRIGLNRVECVVDPFPESGTGGVMLQRGELPVGVGRKQQL